MLSLDEQLHELNAKTKGDDGRDPVALLPREAAPGGKSDKAGGMEPSAGSQERVRYMNGLDGDLYAGVGQRR